TFLILQTSTKYMPCFQLITYIYPRLPEYPDLCSKWDRPTGLSFLGVIHYVVPSTNRSQPSQRAKIHRPHLCHGQSRLLYECPQNRHLRKVPRPPLRETRRPRHTLRQRV